MHLLNERFGAADVDVGKKPAVALEGRSVDVRA
jgi:hypothetical protein